MPGIEDGVGGGGLIRGQQNTRLQPKIVRANSELEVSRVSNPIFSPKKIETGIYSCTRLIQIKPSIGLNDCIVGWRFLLSCILQTVFQLLGEHRNIGSCISLWSPGTSIGYGAAREEFTPPEIRIAADSMGQSLQWK